MFNGSAPPRIMRMAFLSRNAWGCTSYSGRLKCDETAGSTSSPTGGSFHPDGEDVLFGTFLFGGGSRLACPSCLGVKVEEAFNESRRKASTADPAT